MEESKNVVRTLFRFRDLISVNTTKDMQIIVLFNGVEINYNDIENFIDLYVIGIELYLDEENMPGMIVNLTDKVEIFYTAKDEK